MRRRLLRATAAAVLALAALPAVASAHPLGNFTVNHYARVSPSAHAVAVHWVLDMAEIPAFSEMRDMDTDHDGARSPAEQAAWLDAAVPQYVARLTLAVDGRAEGPWTVADRRLSFPAGQGGLSTLRLELDLTVRADLPAAGAAVVFEDGTFADHIGWREIVVVAGAGIRVDEVDVASTSATDELRRYPPDAASAPMDVRQASFHVVPDATAGAAPLSGTSAAAVAPRGNDPLASLAAGDLTPLSAMLAVLAALALGAIHGVSPGHGKTLVAGYLIGSRGTMRQAVWLGMTVAISHTVGVLLLGAVTLAATALLLPERVIEWLALGSALLVIGLGGSLLISQLRQRGTHQHHQHSHNGGAPHAHQHPHAPATAMPMVSARALAALGIVGGIVPSASALLVLLVAVSLHRLVFGLVLVGAFGLGMALVLAGVSASVVVVRGRLTNGHAQWTQKAAVRRIGSALPLASALVVVVIGIALTVGAAANLA